MSDFISNINELFHVLFDNAGTVPRNCEIQIKLFCILAMDQCASKTAVEEYVWKNLEAVRSIFDTENYYDPHNERDNKALVEKVVDSTCRALTAVEMLVDLKGLKFSTFSKKAAFVRDEAIGAYAAIVDAFLKADPTASLMGSARACYMEMTSIVQDDACSENAQNGA
jgi:hypothetical protein